jgi:hypothetical protein
MKASPRTLLTAAALLGVTAAPAAAIAGTGQSAHHLSTLTAPSASPVAIHGAATQGVRARGRQARPGPLPHPSQGQQSRPLRHPAAVHLPERSRGRFTGTVYACCGGGR